jgi:Carboxypeptidase regulatory-like domain
MRAFSLFAVVGLGTLLGGCFIVEGEPVEELDCGLTAYDESRYVASVEVTDDKDQPLCDAEVVLRSRAFETTLQATQSQCNRFYLPSDEGTTYEVTVSKPGYQVFVAHNVAFRSPSVCLGGPRSLRAQLQPSKYGCDGSAALSFQVDLRDERGAPVCDASIVVRDGAFQQTLRPTPLGDGTCFWDGPAERPGTYEVTVDKPGYETLVLPAVTVKKAPGACHIVPAEINATLVPAQVGCTANIVEALALTVRDETGTEVCDATVTASDGTFSATLQSSAGGGACFWSGLPERSGVYDVTVSKPGYTTVALENVIVTADSCHVKTVSLEVTLAPVPPAVPVGG